MGKGRDKPAKESKKPKKSDKVKKESNYKQSLKG